MASLFVITYVCHQLRDCEMGAIVNRELKQRVRPVNGIVAHRPVAKADIKHAAKIIQNLDHKWNIWDESDEKQDKEKQVSVARVGLPTMHFRFDQLA